MTDRDDRTISVLQNGQADLAQRVEDVEGHLARLVEIVTTQLTTTGPEDPNTAGDDCGDEGEEPLEDWVAGLIDRYYLDVALDGWESNTAMRAELVALRIAAGTAFGADPGTWDQLNWHDHLARILARFDDTHAGPRRRAEQSAEYRKINGHQPSEDQEHWPVLG